MEKAPDDLAGMSEAEAKEYIFHHITALKLAEKARESSAAELDKWEKRAELARGLGKPDLAGEAEKEAARIKAKIDGLSAEIDGLKAVISSLKSKAAVSGTIAARERLVDPDLLEQELLILLGKTFNSETDSEADQGQDPGLGEKPEGKDR
ncbi:MAG: chromosome partitioning protein [Treponema sp.]|jgi:hypothetical protein|nr:chromosome partitioning protein [Treponema sp.]